MVNALDSLDSINKISILKARRVAKIGWVVCGLATLLVLLVLTVRGSSRAAGPDGTIDFTFKSGLGANEQVNSIAYQSDGKIIISGVFTAYNSTTNNRIARLNSDGSLDTSFNPGAGANNTIETIALQKDNKILLAGSFTSFNGVTTTRIARLNSDGSLDTSFDSGTGTDNTINVMTLQNDGKILIGGTFTVYNGVASQNIARLNSDGSLDTSFSSETGPGGTLTPSINAITLQNDGKILIGGEFTIYHVVGVNRLARLNSDGSLDLTFNPNQAGSNAVVRSIVIQSDGKIIIGGNFDNFNNVTVNHIARLNNDGSLDASFNTGNGADRPIYKVALQNDGKILIGGLFTNVNGSSRIGLARLNSDGSVDISANPGAGFNGTIYELALQSDGKILIGGDFSTYNNVARNAFARLNPDFSLDTSLNSLSGADSTIATLQIQNDGKILIGGNFINYHDIPNNRIARLNNDGSLDSAFNTGTGASSGINALALQNDSKIVVAGVFTTFNGITASRIARLNPDGSLDNSFNTGTGASSDINALALQSDGKIIAAGVFTTFNGITASRIVRLNPDGSPDSSFNTGTGANGPISALALQTDGKIIIGGNFITYTGTTVNRIARLNTDGSRDTSFTSGTGASGNVWAIALQNDGRVIIAGSFSTYNGATVNRITRLNSNGTRDTSFTNGGGTSTNILTIALQSDGRILIGGLFSTYNNIASRRLARLNADGSLDTSFNMNVGANGSVNTIGIQPDNKVIIGGVFTTVNGYVRNRIARLEASTKAASSVMLTSNSNLADAGSSITFTATVEPITATGTVRFNFGSSNVTTALVNGIATYVTNTLPAGTIPARAIYSGDATLVLSISPLYTQTINKLASSVNLNSSANPAQPGQPITFTAAVEPITATGTVTFTIGAFKVSKPVSNGIVTYMTNTLPTGSYSVTATYGGNATFSPSVSGLLTQVIGEACNPLLVTNSQDDGQATSCGTLSYALLMASSGTTITFSLSAGNTVTFSNSLTPTLKPGVGIDGEANGVILNGNGVAGDGLQLSGSNKLSNLTIRGFSGRELVLASAAYANQLYRVKIES